MISEDDRCTCGHHRAHHVLSCKAMRPVGIGSTPPGFRQHMERCPCAGFVMWKTAAELDAEAGRVEVGAITAAFLVCLVGICLFTLAVMGGRHVMCATHDQAISYCHPAVAK